MPTLRVHVATINHKHGVNFYVALTQEILTNQIADFCKEYPGDAGDPDAYKSAVKKNDASEIMSAYFMGNELEFCDMDVTDLKGIPAEAIEIINKSMGFGA